MMAVEVLKSLKSNERLYVVYFRSAIETNEQHEAEIASSRATAEEHASNSSKDLLQDVDSKF
jgi:uncharacterized protein YrzB (UPF0473 family)